MENEGLLSVEKKIRMQTWDERELVNLRGFKEDLTIKYLNVKKILAVIAFYLFLHSAVQIYMNFIYS